MGGNGKPHHMHMLTLSLLSTHFATGCPQILRVLEDPSLGLVLTPQTFTNVESHADTFNHLNPQFWVRGLGALLG